MQCLTCGMMNIDPLSHTHTKEQPMSDTLPEREDQNAWCDDCHGYTHMPYCPSYVSREVNEQEQPAARGGGERVKVELINGVEGQCVGVNDYRICGPKPWGGGSVAKSWTTDKNDVLRAFLTPDQKHAWLADELEVVSMREHQVLVAEREGLQQTLAGISLLSHAAWIGCNKRGDQPMAATFAEIEKAATNAISQKRGSE